MKKLIAILLSLLLVMSISAAAFAEGETKNDSITVNGVKEGETYNLYKLFDLIVDDEITWEAFFAAADAEAGTEAGPGNQYITVNTAGYVTEISDAAALAAAAAAWTGKPAATDSVTVAEGQTTAVFSGLADGYWLITSTLGTVAMTDTTPDENAVTVEEKNPEDTVAKQVKEDSTNLLGDENDAQIGDTVQFQTVVTLYKGTRNVVVHDEMTAGLTYTAGSIAIEGLTAGTDYTVNESPADGHLHQRPGRRPQRLHDHLQRRPEPERGQRGPRDRRSDQHRLRQLWRPPVRGCEHHDHHAQLQRLQAREGQHR